MLKMHGCFIQAEKNCGKDVSWRIFLFYNKEKKCGARIPMLLCRITRLDILDNGICLLQRNSKQKPEYYMNKWVSVFSSCIVLYD